MIKFCLIVAGIIATALLFSYSLAEDLETFPKAILVSPEMDSKIKDTSISLKAFIPDINGTHYLITSFYDKYPESNNFTLVSQITSIDGSYCSVSISARSVGKYYWYITLEEDNNSSTSDIFSFYYEKSTVSNQDIFIIFTLFIIVFILFILSLFIEPYLAILLGGISSVTSIVLFSMLLSISLISWIFFGIGIILFILTLSIAMTV